MVFEWDEENKAGKNFRKHRVRLPEAIPVFDDPFAVTVIDENIRMISARTRMRTIRRTFMKARYDFSKGKRGRIASLEHEPAGKTRITIRLDEDVIEYFLKKAEESGGEVGYQTMINEALRDHVEGKAPKVEDSLRRIIREELLHGTRPNRRNLVS